MNEQEMRHRREVAMGDLAAGYNVIRADGMLEALDTIDALRAALAAVTEERDALKLADDLSSGCLNMMREVLVDVLGADAMQGTPPMNYNDAMYSALYKVAMGEVEERLYPAGSLWHRSASVSVVEEPRE